MISFGGDEEECLNAFPTDLGKKKKMGNIFHWEFENIFFRFNVKSLLLFKTEGILRETEGKAKGAWGDSFVNIVKLKIK